MKKIFLIISVTASLYSIGQESKIAPPTKSLSIAEANAINGTPQVNHKSGKPYLQWVAEEKAKQQQAESQQNRQVASLPNGMQAAINTESQAAIPKRNHGVTNDPLNGGKNETPVEKTNPAEKKSETGPIMEAVKIDPATFAKTEQPASPGSNYPVARMPGSAAVPQNSTHNGNS